MVIILILVMRIVTIDIAMLIAVIVITMITFGWKMLTVMRLDEERMIYHSLIQVKLMFAAFVAYFGITTWHRFSGSWSAIRTTASILINLFANTILIYASVTYRISFYFFIKLFPWNIRLYLIIPDHIVWTVNIKLLVSVSIIILKFSSSNHSQGGCCCSSVVEFILAAAFLCNTWLKDWRNAWTRISHFIIQLWMVFR